MKPKVSFIEFLNSVPLGWGFLHGPYQDAFELLFDVPAECARHLAEGAADVGLIPVIEYHNIPGLTVLPGISVASRREVKSVLFVSKVPLQRVRRIAVDRSSRTSVALLKIILQHFHRMDSLGYHEERAEPERMLDRYDAALVIGNPALAIRRQHLHLYDLAREWNRFTGLPFVFAFWAVRSGVDLGDKAQLFYRSRELGLQEVDLIAATYSARLKIPAGEIRDYILHNLDYGLDDANLRGLETFYDLSAELGLIASRRSLQFYGHKT